MSGVRFPLGSVYITPDCLEALRQSGDELLPYLIRHVSGDWGEVGKEDWNANEESLRIGERLLSAYTTSDGQTRFWILTERDRSATTALLPSDY
jgi:hypothetical protein